MNEPIPKKLLKPYIFLYRSLWVIYIRDFEILRFNINYKPKYYEKTINPIILN